MKCEILDEIRIKFSHTLIYEREICAQDTAKARFWAAHIAKVDFVSTTL